MEKSWHVIIKIRCPMTGPFSPTIEKLKCGVKWWGMNRIWLCSPKNFNSGITRFFSKNFCFFSPKIPLLFSWKLFELFAKNFGILFLITRILKIFSNVFQNLLEFSSINNYVILSIVEFAFHWKQYKNYENVKKVTKIVKV